MLPRDQVSQAQVNSYLDQERVKRRDMLQKFLAECQKSRMNFDTHLIESDQIVKAVAELIEVLHIKRLIVGVNKSNLRKMKKASCKAVQIQKSAAQYCEVKIICEGREVRDPEQSTVISPAAESLSHDKNTTDGKRTNDEVSEAKQGAVSCSCFSVKLFSIPQHKILVEQTLSAGIKGIKKKIKTTAWQNLVVSNQCRGMRSANGWSFAVARAEGRRVGGEHKLGHIVG
ncbi:hypothetical protein ZIOFF_068275 [Zingiber officinale]|uniref:Uncharacterized protein n=1 Tax=Zingiber officinale TaxID=94328 RepID=A0A8J5EEK4_ZINOF|nr:hypothetical protein ZIOFF_068275 [Zingiber officinale]